MVSWGRSTGIFSPRPAVQRQRSQLTRAGLYEGSHTNTSGHPTEGPALFKSSSLQMVCGGIQRKVQILATNAWHLSQFQQLQYVLLTYNPKSSPPSGAHTPEISLGGFPKHQRETHGSECLWYHACVCMYLYTYASVYFVDTHIDSNRLHR